MNLKPVIPPPDLLTGEGLTPGGKGNRTRAVAQEVEGLFLGLLVKAMRKTVPNQGIIRRSHAEEIGWDLLAQEMGRSLSRGAGIGLGELIARQAEKPSGAGSQEGRVRSSSPPSPLLDGLLEEEATPSKNGRRPAAANPFPSQPDGGHPQAPSPLRQAQDSGQAPSPLRQAQDSGQAPASRMSSAYGFRRDPMTGARRFHRGIDLAATEGTSVYPAKPGTVVFSGRKGKYGNLVIVRHEEGYETYYAHNRENLVRAGERVDDSRPIARVGRTGRATGAHLHFEVRKEGKPLNPQALWENEGPGDPWVRPV